jgi:uncharacterized protein YbjT (DUF2867 family)
MQECSLRHDSVPTFTAGSRLGRGIAGVAVKNIAVIGATGMLGVPVVIELLRAGFEVTALVRNPEKARRVLPEHANIVNADLRDVKSLKSGLKGQDAIYLSLSVAPTEGKSDFHAEAEGLKNILAAARFVGIKRIAYLSAMVQDSVRNNWWVLKVWRDANAQIKSSGIPYTIFYPSNFMETLPQRHMMGGVFVMTGRSPHPNYWIAGRDFGRQVARSFALPVATNREYFVQGPEPMTYVEAARRFVHAAAGQPRIVRLPLSLIRLAGVVSRPMRFNARMMRTVLRYPETFKAEDTWRDLGEPTTTIEEFAKSGSSCAAVASAV